MIRINDNGDLVCDWPDEPGEQTLATAAELKAAYAERGMVVISVEDARLMLGFANRHRTIAVDEAEAFSRLRTATKEAP